MDANNHGENRLRFNWGHALGIAVGLGTQLFFGFTVWHLFFFLRDGSSRSSESFLLTDTLLALQFAVIHSTLLYPSVRQRLQRWIPSRFYGCFFCVVTCLTLLTLITFWQTGSEFQVPTDGWLELFTLIGFYFSWLALFYSLWLSGLGYQTGWTPFWHWLRGTIPPRRDFSERGAYRFFRHPIYLSFLGLIWFAPHLTADRILLMAVWTPYVVIGSYLKDERLAFFLGRRYRDYQERVPGYPLIPFGPLGRRKPETGVNDTQTTSLPCEPSPAQHQGA